MIWQRRRGGDFHLLYEERPQFLHSQRLRIHEMIREMSVPAGSLWEGFELRQIAHTHISYVIYH